MIVPSKPLDLDIQWLFEALIKSVGTAVILHHKGDVDCRRYEKISLSICNKTGLTQLLENVSPLTTWVDIQTVAYGVFKELSKLLAQDNN